MADEQFARQLLFDFFLHEAENLHNRADWFLVFHGILFEAFVTSHLPTHRIALGALGALVSWVWLLAGIRQQWALKHLGECMATANVMGAEASRTFRRLWEARNTRKSLVRRLQATPAFSIILPAAVFATWLVVLASTHTSVVGATQVLWIATAAIIVATRLWIIFYNWPPVPPKALENMTSSYPIEPDTHSSGGELMKRLLLTLGCIAFVAVGVFLGYREGWTRGLSEGHHAGYLQRIAEEQPAQQHHYRFERNGASLWRYDDATGEACQIESSVADNWVGGKCPPK